MTQVNPHLTITEKRKRRVRGKLFGTVVRPRLTVFRSNQHLYAQAIDDQTGLTLAAANDAQLSATDKQKTKTDKAKLVAVELAAQLKKKKISQLVFDRGHYRYHGRVKQLADSLREAGMEF